MESCGYLRAVEFLFDDFPNRPYYVITPMINVLIFYTHTHTHTRDKIRRWAIEWIRVDWRLKGGGNGGCVWAPPTGAPPPSSLLPAIDSLSPFSWKNGKKLKKGKPKEEDYNKCKLQISSSGRRSGFRHPCLLLLLLPLNTLPPTRTCRPPFCSSGRIHFHWLGSRMLSPGFFPALEMLPRRCEPGLGRTGEDWGGSASSRAPSFPAATPSPGRHFVALRRHVPILLCRFFCAGYSRVTWRSCTWYREFVSVKGYG